MKNIIFLVFVLASTLFCQIAIIQDKDGYTNVRFAPNVNSKIIHKVYENEVFFYDSDVFQNTDQEVDWVKVYIPKNDFSLGLTKDGYITGFIHISRLKPLGINFPPYEGNDVKFKYIIAPFDSTNKIIDKRDEKWITAINGRPVWGTDGDFPKNEVIGMEVSVKGKIIPIHRIFYSDIYECTNIFSIYKNKDTYIIDQSNSDGAGFYWIFWVFDENGLKQRLIFSP